MPKPIKNFRLDPEDCKILEQHAKKSGLSQTEVIRVLLRQSKGATIKSEKGK